MSRLKLQPAALIKMLKPPSFVKVPFTLTYICLLLSYLIVLIFYFRLPPVVPLFYSLAQPIQHLAAKEWIFVFPVVLTITTFGHLSLITIYKTYEQLLLQLFSWTTFVITLLLLAALMRIVFIIS